jgi:hypothetical protein
MEWLLLGAVDRGHPAYSSDLFCVSHRKSASLQVFDAFKSHLWTRTNNFFIQDGQLLF